MCCCFVQCLPGCNVGTYIFTLCSMVVPALAFERAGNKQRAWAFATKTLETDLGNAGNNSQLQRSVAQACRGRILAASGRHVEALQEWDDAADSAAKHGFVAAEAMALFDCLAQLDRDKLKGLVAETVPAADWQARREARLAAALGQMVASKAEAEAVWRAQTRGWEDLGAGSWV